MIGILDWMRAGIYVESLKQLKSAKSPPIKTVLTRKKTLIFFLNFKNDVKF